LVTVLGLFELIVVTIFRDVTVVLLVVRRRLVCTSLITILFL
jgi:hypothetical protein